jgi:tetratricopeptide (TPR) repeat protein
MNKRHTACLRRIQAVRVIDCILLVTILSWNCGQVRAEDGTTNPVSDDSNLQAARQHYGRGIELATQGNYSQALQEFQEAYRNRPHFAVLYNIGQAHIALQQPIEAISVLEQYLSEGKEQIPAERIGETNAQIAAEKALIAEIGLTARPDGASIIIDGKEVGKAPLEAAIRVAAGKHAISVRTADGTEVIRDIASQGGERLILTIEVPSSKVYNSNPRHDVTAQGNGLLQSNVISNTEASRQTDSISGSSIRVSTLGYVLGSVGAALGAGAFGHYLWNRSRFEQWQSTHTELASNQQAPDYMGRQIQNNELAGSIQNASHVTVGLAVAGGIFLVSGVTLVVVDRSKRPTLVTEAQSGGRVLSLLATW